MSPYALYKLNEFISHDIWLSQINVIYSRYLLQYIKGKDFNVPKTILHFSSSTFALLHK